jgi:formylglycine-generating enzyme required for sulfatase activity
MVHVKGIYCPGLSHTCLKWKDKAWCRKHDPVTKKCIDEVKPVACAQFQIPGKCLSKPNELQPLDFCIDIYEGGVKKGEIPPYMKSYLDGKQECAAKGKRLCTDIEWTKACEGPENLPYPYGYARNANACNIDHPQIAGFDASKVVKWTPALLQSLDKRVPAGSMPLCVSPYGVHDMTGNVDEATVNVTGGGKPYWNALKGGHWVAGARNRCRPSTTSHEESFVNYESSIRCCKNSSN